MSRVDYGERDRILTLLCKEAGKISVLAKSVRAQKSRLAGGVELLSESEISFVDTRSDLKTLTGARLKRHFEKIAQDMLRMNLAFEHIKIINSIADESAGQEYYAVLMTSLDALNDASYDPLLIDIWFNLQVLNLSGISPNLQLGTQAVESNSFDFDYDHQMFIARQNGAFSRNDLKLLRLAANHSKPPKIQNLLGSEVRLQSLTKNLIKINAGEI